MINYKEIPLLFQTEMVQAVLEDRKTQTRRTKGLERLNERPDEFELNGYTDENEWTANPPLKPGSYSLFQCINKSDIEWWIAKCPYGKPGDLLWVRETFLERIASGEFGRFGYKADMKHARINNLPRWKPSIHMPKAACRIWLMVEEIRVERLQDISEEDAVSEGIKHVRLHQSDSWKRYDGYNTVTSNPVVSFWSLWASINGEDSWQANPWVWVVKFRVLSTTGRPSDDIIRQNWKEVSND